MRIGILTLHDSVNYGALAQAYALKSHLTRLGHDVRVIDRRRDAGENAWRIPAIPSPSCRVAHFWPVAAHNGADLCALRIARTQAFLRQYVALTDYSFHDWSQAPADLGIDLMIVGSDQVWNAHNLDPADYMPLRGSSASVPAIAYAASIGTPALPPEHLDDLRRGLARFRAVSVREQEGIALLEPLGCHPTHVVDPVFLAGAAPWQAILSQGGSPTDEGRVFAYFLAEDFRTLYPALGAFARSRGTQVEYFADWFCLGEARHLKDCRRNARILRDIAASGVHLRADAGPIEFVRSIAAADIVVTNSYHALAFALLFGKAVRVVLPTHPTRQAMNARLVEFSRGLVSGPLVHASLAEALRSLASGEVCSLDAAAFARQRHASEEWLKAALKTEPPIPSITADPLKRPR